MRGGGYSDIEPETGPDAPPLVAVASPPPSESARKQPVNSSYSPPLIGLANKAEAQPHIEAMRAIARPSSRMRPSLDPLPEPTPERRAAALATFEAFDAAMDLEQEISRLPKKGVGLSLDSPSLNRGVSEMRTRQVDGGLVRPVRVRRWDGIRPESRLQRRIVRRDRPCNVCTHKTIFTPSHK